MNKKTFIIVLIITSLVIIVFFCSIFWINIRIENTHLRINSVIGENRFLKDSFRTLLTTDSINIDSITLSHGEKKIKLKEIAEFPCLIIHLPSTKEEICNSCLTFALNEAKKNCNNFSTNKHIYILSVGANPEIKERIYKKFCYIIDKSLTDIPQTNMPYYFILEKNGKINYLFSPNYLFKEYTDIYWIQLKSSYPILYK